MTNSINTDHLTGSRVDPDQDAFHKRRGAVMAGAILTSVLLLSACSDGDGGSGVVTGGGDEDNDNDQDASQFEPVQPATFDSTDSVALMAPGSLYVSTVGPNRAFRAVVDPKLNNNAAQTSTDCDREGRIEVLDDGSTPSDVMSPYTGATFNVAVSEYEECENRGEFGDSTSARAYSNGLEAIGYPMEGEGSSNDPDLFIAYVQSGASFEAPYTTETYVDDRLILGSTRFGEGHLQFEADPEAEVFTITGGGNAQLSYVSDYAGESENGLRLVREQLGNPLTGERLSFSYTSITDDNSTQEAREETYEGIFGRELLISDGDVIPETCMLGRFEVSTQQPLIVERLPDGARAADFLGTFDEVQSGVLNMEDNFGNQATVTYNGSADTVEVTLNGGATETYTYEDISQIRSDRCRPQ